MEKRILQVQMLIHWPDDKKQVDKVTMWRHVRQKC